MYRLLNAGFSRLVKDKLFLGSMVITIAIASFMLITRYMDGVKYIPGGFPLKNTEELLLDFVKLIGILMAACISLFVGAEYAYGTIRNKIVVGHSRTHIYITNLILSIAIGMGMELLYIGSISIIGIPLFGGIQMPISEFAILLIDTLLVILAYASIFNCISLLCSNITISTVVCILLTLIMMVVGLNSTFCLNLMPAGQAFQIAIPTYRMEANITIMPVYAIGVCLVINSIGIYVFKRKELK